MRNHLLRIAVKDRSGAVGGIGARCVREQILPNVLDGCVGSAAIPVGRHQRIVAPPLVLAEVLLDFGKPGREIDVADS